jgi:hypothetical protein
MCCIVVTRVTTYPSALLLLGAGSGAILMWPFGAGVSGFAVGTVHAATAAARCGRWVCETPAILLSVGAGFLCRPAVPVLRFAGYAVRKVGLGLICFHFNGDFGKDGQIRDVTRDRVLGSLGCGHY